MTTYTWTEHQMIVAPTEGELTNVVKRVVAVYTAYDGTETYSQLLNVELDPPDPMDFTPYEDLTLIQVIGWVEAKLDLSALQDYLDARLAELYLVTMACPWD